MIAGIRTYLGVYSDQRFVWISSNSCTLNLQLDRSHQTETIIVARFNQGRNYVTRIWIEPKICDQGHRKNKALPFRLCCR